MMCTLLMVAQGVISLVEIYTVGSGELRKTLRSFELWELNQYKWKGGWCRNLLNFNDI
jgi:hypothetical protein